MVFFLVSRVIRRTNVLLFELDEWQALDSRVVFVVQPFVRDENGFFSVRIDSEERAILVSDANAESTLIGEFRAEHRLAAKIAVTNSTRAAEHHVVQNRLLLPSEEQKPQQIPPTRRRRSLVTFDELTILDFFVELLPHASPRY